MKAFKNNARQRQSVPFQRCAAEHISHQPFVFGAAHHSLSVLFVITKKERPVGGKKKTKNKSCVRSLHKQNLTGFNINWTDCLKVVPGAFGVISSADEDSSDSLSDPVAKKRDIAEGGYQSAKTQLQEIEKLWNCCAHECSAVWCCPTKRTLTQHCQQDKQLFLYSLRGEKAT